jgi:hypothetical protein
MRGVTAQKQIHVGYHAANRFAGAQALASRGKED